MSGRPTIRSATPNRPARRTETTACQRLDPRNIFIFGAQFGHARDGLAGWVWIEPCPCNRCRAQDSK